MKKKWIESLRSIANEIETVAQEADDQDYGDGAIYDEAISYIRLAIDELRSVSEENE